MRGGGFLIVWSDVEPHEETDYIHWLTREHTTERVSTGGFIAVRVFRATLPTANRYLINYELESPTVVDSPAYLAKLNNPTPWTRQTLPRLKNFLRGGGRVLHSGGIGRGGVVAACIFAGPTPPEGDDIVKALARCDRISAAHIYETDRSRTAVPTEEKEVRKVDPGHDDRSFSGVLLIEGIDEGAIRGAVAQLPRFWPQLELHSPHDTVIYRSVFVLEKRDTAR